MNNDTQNTAGPTNSQLGPTRNPQNSGGQNLGAGGGNLQNPTNLVTDSDNLSITSVGNSDSTKPTTIQTTTQATSEPVQPSDNPPYGILILSALVIGLIFFVTWFVNRPREE